MKRNILFVLCLAISTTLAAAPNVVVSIMPLHGIVSDVMENVGEPALILKRNDSPHDYALRPSDARLMAASDLVIWVGPELEGFLRKPIANIADRAQLLTLAERQLPVVLSYKQGHDHDHGHGSSDDSDDHNDSLFDPHIWLSTENAIYIEGEEDGSFFSNAGAAYIFKKDEGGIDNWGQIQKIYEILLKHPKRLMNSKGCNHFDFKNEHC